VDPGRRSRHDDLLTYPQRSRMPRLLVRGRTGMGKTTILRKFGRDHSRSARPRSAATSSPSHGMRPALGSTNRLAVRSSVDLPAPIGR
jgi:hypothetical protein